MDLGLDGKTAVVAGGSAGLGFACAREFVRAGANVAIASRSADRVGQAVLALQDDQFVYDRDCRVEVTGRALDVADFDSARSWLEEVAERYGGIDILVANAGGPPVGSATEVSLAQYREAIEVNLLASINLADLVVGRMQAAGWGRVLFVTSISAKEPVRNLALSNTARAGVLGYAKSLAGAVAGDGVTVNVLAPGYTRTARLVEAVAEKDLASLVENRIPVGRVGEPEEFAAAAAFLASERASFITGVVLAVDGGSTASLF